jgi:NitT/TauT family transport system substrate-binding protein
MLNLFQNRTVGTKHALMACAAAALIIAGLSSPAAQAADTKLTVFVGPVVYNDALWMADAKGFYKEAGLDVELKPFASGSTALQSFGAGQGDIVVSGELPSVSYWASHPGEYKTVFAISRESKGEVAMASTEIKSAQDLVGKVVGTRVGSTGSWFIAEYLAAAGVDTSKVEVKNLETQILPTALCGGDIDAFFIWEPFGTRAKEICGDKIHKLTDATGYMNAYLVAGVRPTWLLDKANSEALSKFIAATLKGKAVAEKDFPSVAAYVEEKFGMSEAAAKPTWEVLERPIGFDQTFYDDFCKLANWMKSSGSLEKEFSFADYLDTNALKAADGDHFVAPPAGCK